MCLMCLKCLISRHKCSDFHDFAPFFNLAPFFSHGREQLSKSIQRSGTSIRHLGFIGNIYFCKLYTLPSPHTKFQAQRTRFDKSCIINEMTVNIIVFIHIWYLHTLTYPHTKFHDQRTLFDISWIIDEMTVTIIYFHLSEKLINYS